MMIRLGLFLFFSKGVRAFAPCRLMIPPLPPGAAHMGSHPGPRHGAAPGHYNTPASGDT